ncbi:MAG: hypothetical protein M3O20_08100, partial [Acidobacteriota bacterium]|nr:hypothetical protein [Acidobacteriota bacterium]
MQRRHQRSRQVSRNDPKRRAREQKRYPAPHRCIENFKGYQRLRQLLLEGRLGHSLVGLRDECHAVGGNFPDVVSGPWLQ